MECFHWIVVKILDTCFARYSGFVGDHKRTCAELHTNDGEQRRVRMELPKSTPKWMYASLFQV